MSTSISILALVLFALLLQGESADVFADDEIPVVQGTFRVEPGKFSYRQWKVPMYFKNPRIVGNMSASGGSGNDIRVLVLNEQQFRAFRHGQRTDVLYDSGQRRSVVLSVPLSEIGTHYIVFDNRFSALSPKNVSADIRFVHQGADLGKAERVRKEATERERRIGEILGRVMVALQAEERRLGTHQISGPIYFGIIDDKSLNAFAVWDRRLVAITRGTVELVESLPTREQGDSLLASVLGHEVAHIFYRHSSGNPTGQAAETAVAASAGALMVHPLAGLVAGALAYDRNLKYDRMQEAEADALGVRLACAAGFDPKGALAFHAKINAIRPGQASFLNTHPSPPERLASLRREISSLSGCPGTR